MLESILKTILLTRKDVRDAVGNDRRKLDVWLLTHARKEYTALRELCFTRDQKALNEPSPSSITSADPQMTILIEEIWKSNVSLQRWFDIHTADGQAALVWWYLVVLVPDFHLENFLTDRQLQAMCTTTTDLKNSSSLPSIELAKVLWKAYDVLQREFPLDTLDASTRYIRWFYTDAYDHPHLGDLVGRVHRHMETTGVFPSNSLPTSFSKASIKVRNKTTASARGVNLVGHVMGQFGIGEDVRMAAAALQAADIPFSIFNAEVGPEIGQDDHSFDEFISSDLPFATTIFCTTGVETARLRAVYGEHLFRARRKIGFWPWELPKWPAEWAHAYELVDEIWAASRFAYEAYARDKNLPVHHMPMAVVSDDTEHMTRSDFNLPDQNYIFVFSFDNLSSFARKNPMGCVKSFKQAFPSGKEKVNLVIKSMRTPFGDKDWFELQSATAEDDRIIILAETYKRGKLLDLYRLCDCFVSLHRSEGFGRCIAEAMLLGKPVIATGYSGNMDFTNNKNAALVSYDLAPVGIGEYPFGHGQYWAEPNLENASQWMRRLAQDRELGMEMGRTASGLLKAVYSPVSVGTKFVEALW